MAFSKLPKTFSSRHFFILRYMTFLENVWSFIKLDKNISDLTQLLSSIRWNYSSGLWQLFFLYSLFLSSYLSNSCFLISTHLSPVRFLFFTIYRLLNFPKSSVYPIKYLSYDFLSSLNFFSSFQSFSIVWNAAYLSSFCSLEKKWPI